MIYLVLVISRSKYALLTKLTTATLTTATLTTATPTRLHLLWLHLLWPHLSRLSSPRQAPEVRRVPLERLVLTIKVRREWYVST